MASFNRVILMGNLTRDPEARQTQSGTTVVNAGVAVNERMPDGQGGWKEEASFFDVVLFGKRGEAFERYMRKGRPVLIEGKLRQSRWQDRESGQNRSKIEVIVDNWEFVGGREDGNGGPPREAQHASSSGSSPDFPARSDFGGGGGLPDDVPF